MMKQKLKLRLFKGFLTVVTIISGFALSVKAAANVPTWIEHPDIISIVISGLFIIVSWLLVKLYTKIDKNQGALFERMRAVETEVARLEGKCEGLQEKKKHA